MRSSRTGRIARPVSYTHLDVYKRQERGPAFIPFDGAAYNASEGAATFAALPEKYDLRNVDGASFVTSVKNQGVYGDCWAFGTLSSLESNLLKTGKSANVDLSERHLDVYKRQV